MDGGGSIYLYMYVYVYGIEKCPYIITQEKKYWALATSRFLIELKNLWYQVLYHGAHRSTWRILSESNYNRNDRRDPFGLTVNWSFALHSPPIFLPLRLGLNFKKEFPYPLLYLNGFLLLIYLLKGQKGIIYFYMSFFFVFFLVNSPQWSQVFVLGATTTSGWDRATLLPWWVR